MTLQRFGWALALAVAVPVTANAASLSPSSYSATIGVGDSISVDKTITLDAGAAINKVDVFFLSDNTGSMGGIISNVKSVASDLLTAITGGDSRFDGVDAAFGVGRYLGDPSEGVAPATAYQLQQAITTSQADTQTAINAWFASGGGDGPEANFFALQQVATSGADTDSGVGTGQDTGWRTGAGSVIVWFGDAPSHEETIDLAETISALTDNDVIVAAINTRSAGFGIDSDDQASDIVTATGGTLQNNISGTDAVLDAILDALEDATSTIDLSFATVGDTSGLDVSFACTDALGCDDVEGGESRTFRMDITGLTPGTYDFETIVVGTDAVETDSISVTDGTGGPGVPEPATLALLGAGLAGLGFAARRRRDS